MAPLVSQLVNLGQVEPTAYSQTECFEAGVTFAKAEGILPAPEANHAVKGALVEALRCKEEGESKAILFNLCGHGYFDMQAYMTIPLANWSTILTMHPRLPWPFPACRLWPDQPCPEFGALNVSLARRFSLD